MTQVRKIEPPTIQAATPMDMIDRAVSSGASVEALEKLMVLQERWEANQGRKAFNQAIAAASGDRINADQFVVVQGLLEEAGADEAKFLQFIGAASLEELTLRQFDTAVAALRKKIAQKKGA